MKSRIVSFSGYRPEKMPDGGSDASHYIIAIKKSLRGEIDKSIAEGYDTFMVGMAQGFDTYAAIEILNAKQNNPHIKLICVLPFEGTSTKDATYTKIIQQADETKILSKATDRSSYYTRNEYLINHCEKLICYYDGLGGGTEYTVDYANRKGVLVVNLAPPKQPSLGGMELFDNRTKTVRDDLDRSIRKGSKLSILDTNMYRACGYYYNFP